jgi:hypothetical protein
VEMRVGRASGHPEGRTAQVRIGGEAAIVSHGR